MNLFKALSDCISFETHAAFIALIFNSKSVMPIPPSDMGRISVLRFILSLFPQRNEKIILFICLIVFCSGYSSTVATYKSLDTIKELIIWHFRKIVNFSIRHESRIFSNSFNLHNQFFSLHSLLLCPMWIPRHFTVVLFIMIFCMKFLL